MAPGAVSEDTPNGVTNGVTNGETNGTPVEKSASAEKSAEAPSEKSTSFETTASVTPAAPVLNVHCCHCASVAQKKEEGTTDGETKETEKDKKLEEGSDSDSDADKKDEKPEDQTMKCEMKHLDRKYDEKDETYFVERKSDVDKPKQKDWWQLFAFCLVRHYDEDDDLDYTRLYVNPQPLRQLLKDVIGDYPSDPIDVDDVQIESPYHSLFHYRKEVEEEGLKRFADDEESLKQLKLLVEWIKSHFELDIAAYDRCLNGDVKSIAYDRLWTIFPTKTVVHCKVLNQHRAYRIYNTWYEEGDQAAFWLSMDYVDFDGEDIGTRRTNMFVPKYVGMQALSEMCVRPLHLLDDADELRKDLTERGRKFESFIGQHYLQYNGIAVKRGEKGYIRFNVSGRVMIDCRTYHRLDPNDSFTVEEFPQNRGRENTDDFEKEGYDFEKLSDDDLMLCNAFVRGYAFSTKQFMEFRVDLLQPIEWNTKCFDGLVLDPAVKQTVRALVSTHAQKRESFDDIVKGKGQGLVCVLHGPPGVGKTLTAECVAEYVQRPLYMVSSGDLGTHSSALDGELTRIMDMTSTWRAVLLIDEADVFLEQRALHDLNRNAMVSVFLRVLEYYSGILFLTTNRVNTFDDAFKSRIHIPIRYTDLSFESRRKIWKNFCKMVPGGVDISEKGYDILAEHDLNGRQIKNAIKAAESLSVYDGVKLDLEQLLQVTKIQEMFEKDLTSVSGIDYTAPGQSRKDADRRNMFL
ncbi:P-loop containing nucleoside triphosphate hydrolase protein [Rhypophila decipiens]|uniref:P-loop containing nucleoside triphosphate hydrolase protein n=1 Tax=Rhypophila decipiens TaxID=261697 RepID=A0AAN7B556_9PEZI|nr:P-loop containing nucleoside triphosphate hydrolase protein [Rhypophila decipiens]